MGQIVSAAAKPKRCNANQLSQVPTPAAGEHILVSSDNSMNAAGQGKFDAYVVGDGKTAATALELKSLTTIWDNEVDEYMVSFMEPKKNLVNPREMHYGQFMQNGTYRDSSSYDATGMIPVLPNTTYTARNDEIGTPTLRFITYFDADKSYLSHTDGSATFTTSANAYFVVCTFYHRPAEEYQIEKGSEATEYEAYSRVIKSEFLPEIEVEDGSINNNKIADKAVSINKLSFAESVNLVNQNDADVAIGYRISFDRLVEDATYNTTGWIPVKPNTKYWLTYLGAAAWHVRYIRTFNSQKVGITTYELPYVTTEANAAYIRVTYRANVWETAQVTEGDTALEFMPYSLKIQSEYLNLAEGVFFHLPKDIWVANGRTIELYYEQILLNAHKYNIEATCDVGKNLKRKYQLNGSASLAGSDHTLTLIARDDAGNAVATGVSTIHFTENPLQSVKKVLPIGDSLTNLKPWMNEVKALADSKIEFVGTRSSYHEGRSGEDCAFYNTTDATRLYTFDHNYTGAGYNADNFSSTTNYAVGDYCKYNGSVYVFTTAHSAGAWNASHVFNLSDTNPFIDWQTGNWSIGAYKTRNNITYDAVAIFLGTNGLSLTPETNANGALGIKTLVDNIRAEEPSIPIIILNIPYRPSQNGIGNQGNTNGYNAQSEYKFRADKKVTLLADAVQKMLGEYTNLYICPVGFCMDSEYDYNDYNLVTEDWETGKVYAVNQRVSYLGISYVCQTAHTSGTFKDDLASGYWAVTYNGEMQVNPRIPLSKVSEWFPYDSIHPTNAGYYQIADELYSALCKIFSE